jgi:hypothetical protein
MKRLTFIILIFLSCNTPNHFYTSINDVKVLYINKDVQEVGCIYTCCHKRDTFLIVSQSLTTGADCIRAINLGDILNIQLIKEYKLNISGVSHKLYENDIYVQGKLIFDKKIVVYSSPKINGQCIVD